MLCIFYIDRCTYIYDDFKYWPLSWRYYTIYYDEKKYFHIHLFVLILNYNKISYTIIASVIHHTATES